MHNARSSAPGLPGLSLLALLLALPTSAAAQDEGAQVEQIVVTAQKREQRWLDVPINLTAMSGDFLDDLGLYDFERVGTLVPGVTIQAQSANNPGYNVRGITSDDGSSQFEDRVSLYEDGVPISRSRGSYIEIFDVERVEVLKGPQSTLFGRSAEIGAISVISNKPDDELSGSVRLGGGNLGYFIADAYVNVPVSEGMQTRFAIIHRDREGFQENLAGGTLNGLNVTAIRGSMRFLPSDDVTIDVILGYQHNNAPGTGFKAMNLPTIGSTTSPFTAADLERDGQLGLKRNVYSATGLTEWQLNDDWSLSFNTSWRQFDTDEAFDADGSASPALFFHEIVESKQANQEIRANYVALEGDLTGFIGVDFFYEDGSQAVPLVIDDATVFPIGTAPPQDVPGLLYNPVDGFVQNGNDTLFEMTNFGTTYELDLFTDATYRLIDALDFTAGVRGIYLWKNSEFISPDAVSQPGTVCPGLGDLPCSALFDLGGLTTNGELLSKSGNFGKAVGRAVFSYDFNDRFDTDATAFAGWNRGWRAPVVQVEADGSEIVPGETVDSYEIGAKGLFLDGRLQLEGSFYYYTYENFQLTFFDRSSLGFLTIDGGNATGYGTELASNSQITEDLNFFANFAWTHARFDDDVFIPAGTEGLVNLKGAQFRLTPEYKFNVGGQYYRPVNDDVNVYATTWLTWQSEIYFETSNDPQLTQGSYGLWNTRVGFNVWNEQLEVAMFGYNLLDKNYVIDAGNTGYQFGIPTFVAGTPRTWGGEVTWRF
ncbi:MAG: TonB-dependent receptor [Deltaproteobacteria bacterium]|nr:TonB-dependent receptor [Deltaproteobacteria bacterium]